MNRIEKTVGSGGALSLFGALNDNRDAEMRNAVVDAALVGTAIFMIPGLLVETLRATQIGLLPINYVHAVINPVFLGTAVFRRHLGYQTKAFLVLGYLVAMAVAATLTFGTAPGVSFLSAFCIMFGVFYGFRSTMIAMVLCMVGLLGLYLLPLYGVTPWPRTPSFSIFGVWATNVGGFAFIVFGPISAMHTFRRAIERQKAEAERLAREQSQLLERYISSVEATQKAMEGERTARAEVDRILSSTSEGFMTFDSELRLIYANPVAERLLGFAASDWQGRTVDADHPDWRPGGLHERLLSAAPCDGDAIFEFQHESTGRWLEVRTYPSEQNFSVHLRDISFNVEAEHRMREMQKMETIGQLSGGVAHDFNNLLTVVIGSSATLAEELSEPRHLRLAELILRAARQGGELTRQLLAFARRQPLAPRVIDINALLNDNAALIRRTLGADLDFSIVNTEDLRFVYADPAQTEAAILNLCINARDAMPDGGKLVVATENATLSDNFRRLHPEAEPGDYVAIRVSDTGTGIAPDVIAKIFEPFFTTKETGKGTGLGLSMVYGFVKQSGGYVDLESELGKGTTFTLYLPVAEGDAEATEASDGGEQPIEGGSENVLIVEDDDLVREHVRGEFESLGYQVIVASHGAEALSVLEGRDDIDLLFTDIVMPGGMNGRQLAKTATARWPWLRVLYTSGYSRDALMLDGRLVEGVTLLSKPYSKRELSEKTRQVLDEI